MAIPCREILSDQLAFLAGVLPQLSDEQLPAQITDLCTSLLDIALTGLSDADTEEEVLQDVSAGIICLAGKIASFSPLLRVKTPSLDALRALRENSQLLGAQEAEARAQLAAVSANNHALSARVEELSAELSRQQMLNRTLRASLDECSPEAILALSEENLSLDAQLTAESAALAQQKKTHAELTEKVRAVHAQMNAMPREQQLVKLYDRAMERLNRLKISAAECSYEKRQQLNNEIAELENENAMNSAEYATLRARLEEMRAAQTRVSSDMCRIEADILEFLDAHMDQLKNLMSANVTRLDGIKRTAETVKSHIAECDLFRRNYAFMFSSLLHPLEDMAKAAGAEHGELEKHLDINRTARIKTLRANIERDLGELGEILSNCLAAAGEDQTALEKKAGLN